MSGPSHHDRRLFAAAHGKGCWYFISRWACVLCGRTEEIRERRWTPRPVEPEQRGEYREEACGDHFC